MFPAILQPYESVLCIVGHAEILLNDVLHWITCTLPIGDYWTNLGKETTTTKYNKQTSTHIAYIGHISHMWSQFVFVLLGQTFRHFERTKSTKSTSLRTTTSAAVRIIIIAFIRDIIIVSHTLHSRENVLVKTHWNKTSRQDVFQMHRAQIAWYGISDFLQFVSSRFTREIFFDRYISGKKQTKIQI